MRRRFPIVFHIKDYNYTELYNILLKLIKDENWKLEKNALLENDIKQNMDIFYFFGGDMKLLFQIAKELYCIRLMKNSITINKQNKLSRTDIINSIEQLKDSRKEKKNEIPDSVKHMYI